MYEAIVVDVIDGDTIIASVTLDFDIRVELTFRLLGIDTPEVKGVSKEAGVAASVYLNDRIINKTIQIQTVKTKKGKNKKDKYGRYLGRLFLDDIDLNQELIDKGYARIMK